MTKHIVTIDLNDLSILRIRNICKQFYDRTGQKFGITFNGSKGYLDHILISIEGRDLYNIKTGNQKMLFIFENNPGDYWILEAQ